MISLIPLAQAAQDTDGLSHAGLLSKHLHTQMRRVWQCQVCMDRLHRILMVCATLSCSANTYTRKCAKFGTMVGFGIIKLQRI